MTEDRQIVFLGTPHAAVTILDRLIDEGFNVAHVITRPDARRGRGSSTSPSPVKVTALRHGIEVSHDLSWLDEHTEQDLLGVVVAYGRIIPARVLERVRMVNVHFSLLPRWRGAAPVERAILAGDRVTGVCLMELEPTLDTGPVFARAEIEIDDSATTATLTNDLASVGGRLLVDVLRSGLPTPEPQEGEVTYAEKISPTENRIDWTRSAVEISRQVRALRTHTVFRGSRIRILSAVVEPDPADSLDPGLVDARGRVGTGHGLIRLTMVQPEGRGSMDAGAWLRGLQPLDGVRFG